MDTLFRAIKALPPGKRLALGALLLLVAATWLAVCLVMASYVSP
jgi:hypothetical protein